MKTNTAIIGGEVTGNIGSCSVVSTNINVNSFYLETLAVNSCTGEIVRSSGVYFDGTWIAIPLLLFTVIFSIGALFKWMMDY